MKDEIWRFALMAPPRFTIGTLLKIQAIKDIYVYPLVRDARQRLCGELEW